MGDCQQWPIGRKKGNDKESESQISHSRVIMSAVPTSIRPSVIVNTRPILSRVRLLLHAECPIEGASQCFRDPAEIYPVVDHTSVPERPWRYGFGYAKHRHQPGVV